MDACVSKLRVGKRRGWPIEYDFGLLSPALRVIWESTDFSCALRLAAMLPEWIPAHEGYHRSLKEEVRQKLLEASPRTLERLLSPLRLQTGRRCLTRPGTLLRQQIPIRGSVWEENAPGWLEVDTVALSGGAVLPETLSGWSTWGGRSYFARPRARQ